MPPSLPSAGSGRDAWAEALLQAGDPWLVELLSLRPDLALAGPRDLRALADQVVSPGSVSACYLTVDYGARQVADALCVLPSPTDLDALTEVLNADQRAVEHVVERLAAAALVLWVQPDTGRVQAGWRDQVASGSGAAATGLTRNPGLSQAVPHPAGLGQPGRELLGRYPGRDLTDMAARIGVVAKGTKSVVLDGLLHALSSPDRVAESIGAGPPGTVELAAALAVEPLEVPLTWGMYETGRTDRTPEGWLLRRGMLVPTGWGSAVMPAEVALAWRGGRLFPSFWAEEPPLVVSAVDPGQTDAHAAEEALGLVRDVAALLESWAAEPARLLRSGGLGVREVRRVAKLTGRSEPAAARVVDLMVCAGLVAVDGEVVLPTSTYDRWSDLPAAARWEHLARAWADALVHLSVAGALDSRDKPIPPLLDRPAEGGARVRRREVLDLLAGLPQGQAVEGTNVAEISVWRAPGLWQGGPAEPAQLVSWVLEEARLLGLMADGAPSSFGRCFAAGNPSEAISALSAFAPPVTSQFVLQADLTAVVSGEMAPELRRELDLLADVESSGAATVFRFSETSLRRGFDAGRSVGQISAWLGDHATKGVPQPLRFLLDDLGRRFGRVRVGSAGSYLRSDDPALVTEVIRARRTARLHLRLLAPTVAVSDADPMTVVRTLREAGYLAAPEEDDGTLTITRPPSRRASTGDEFDVDVDAVLGDVLTDPDMLDDPERLAAFVGLPASALPPGLLAGVARLLNDAPAGRSGGEGSDGAGADSDADSDEAIDLPTMVSRLRAAPTPPDGPPSFGPAGRSTSVPVSIGNLDFRTHELPRPTLIVKGSAPIAEMLELAVSEDWTVRMSFVDPRDGEVDAYAEVYDVGSHAARVQCYPDEVSRVIELTRIRWVRVATQAEENAVIYE